MDSNALSVLVALCRTKKVLYVEDDVEVRTQTAKMLRLYFQEVVEVDNGLDALKRFCEEPFDVIFTDITMPKMDGLSMIEKIRQMNPTIPIIIFSAYHTTEYFLKTIQHGVSGYILKPFVFKDIVATLEKIVPLFTVDEPHSLALIEGYYWERETQCLCKGHEAMNLSKHESAFFELLSSSKQKVFSSEEIEIAVFDDDLCDNKRVRNLLSRLRQKLGCDVIQSIYAEGYKLRWRH